jgi:hypothetical protein
MDQVSSWALREDLRQFTPHCAAAKRISMVVLPLKIGNKGTPQFDKSQPG